MSSARLASTVPPSARMLSHTRARSVSRISGRHSSAPSFASARAVARPMALAAPVIKHLRCRNERMRLLPRGRRLDHSSVLSWRSGITADCPEMSAVTRLLSGETLSPGHRADAINRCELTGEAMNQQDLLQPAAGWAAPQGTRLPPPPPRERGLLFRTLALASRWFGRPELPHIFPVLNINRRIFPAWLFFASRMMPFGKLPATVREKLILR